LVEVYRFCGQIASEILKKRLLAAGYFSGIDLNGPLRGAALAQRMLSR
jgi:hypothetical protein